MTVGELKKRLARLRNDRMVMLYDDQRTFPLHPVGGVEVRDVDFSEDEEPNGDPEYNGPITREKCVVIHPE